MYWGWIGHARKSARRVLLYHASTGLWCGFLSVFAKGLGDKGKGKYVVVYVVDFT